jgi:hypothetical protein
VQCLALLANCEHAGLVIEEGYPAHEISPCRRTTIGAVCSAAVTNLLSQLAGN